MYKVSSFLKYISFSILLLSIIFCIAGCRTTQETPQSIEEETPSQILTEISASAEVVPLRWATLSYPSGANNLEFSHLEGTTVEEDEVLVTTTDPQYTISLLQAEATAIRSQFAYDQAQAQPSEAVELAARAALANAEIYLKSRQDIGASSETIDAAQLDVDAAQANLDSILAGSSTEELESLEKELSMANTALEQAQDAFYLTAPFDGTIVDILPNPGENVSPLEPVLIFADLSEFRIITTDLSEVDVTRLSLGQTANVVFDAISDQFFEGIIEHIADKSTGVSSVYYEVTIKLDETPENLRWGMSAYIIFPLN